MSEKEDLSFELNPMRAPAPASAGATGLDGQKDLSELDQWMLKNSRPEGTFKDSIMPPGDVEGGEDSWDAVGCKHVSLIDPITGKTFELDFLNQWSKFFNALVVSSKEDYIQKEVPYLHAALYVFFHSTVVSIQLYGLAYLAILEVIIYYSWPGYTLGQCAVYSSLCFFVYMASKVVKGSLAMKTVRKTENIPAPVEASEAAPLMEDDSNGYATSYFSTKPVLDSLRFMWAWKNLCGPELDLIKSTKLIRKSGARQVNFFMVLRNLPHIF